MFVGGDRFPGFLPNDPKNVIQGPPFGLGQDRTAFTRKRVHELVNAFLHVIQRPDGNLVELETPYPGGNLFSLASGGAIFVRDPHCRLGEDQLNGGEFTAFEARHWALLGPLLEENERLFGIPISWLLQVDGVDAPPERVYRAIFPSGHKALMPEEAWVAH